MNKKFMKLIICLLVCIFGYNLNVFAEAANVEEGSASDPSNLKANYNKGLSQVTVSSSNTTVTLYGKSECDGSSCKITYAASGNSSFKDALARTVTCSNGETNITYQMGGSGKSASYNESNSTKYNGTAYWSEDYFVTCTNDSSGNTNVGLSGSSGSSSGGSASSGSTSSGSSSSGSSQSGSSTGANQSASSSSSYQSSTTVNNENTGIKTYFIVLGLVAIISYVFMLCVKKFNLFKNI